MNAFQSVSRVASPSDYICLAEVISGALGECATVGVLSPLRALPKAYQRELVKITSQILNGLSENSNFETRQNKPIANMARCAWSRALPTPHGDKSTELTAQLEAFLALVNEAPGNTRSLNRPEIELVTKFQQFFKTISNDGETESYERVMSGDSNRSFYEIRLPSWPQR